MSEDLLRIFETMNRSELDTQLALQCAPLLTGIKLSNLLIVQKSNKNAVIRMFKKSAISYYILCSTDNKVTFLLFYKDKLLQYMNDVSAREILHVSGYYKYDLESVLQVLSNRYSNYIKQKHSFPHEIGIFLGYPLDDVAGFINHQGKNYLYTGYWKVYNNLPEAIQVFEKYKQATELVIRVISQGVNIHYFIDCSNASRIKNSYVF